MCRHSSYNFCDINIRWNFLPDFTTKTCFWGFLNPKNRYSCQFLIFCINFSCIHSIWCFKQSHIFIWNYTLPYHTKLIDTVKIANIMMTQTLWSSAKESLKKHCQNCPSGTSSRKTGSAPLKCQILHKYTYFYSE